MMHVHDMADGSSDRHSWANEAHESFEIWANEVHESFAIRSVTSQPFVLVPTIEQCLDHGKALIGNQCVISSLILPAITSIHTWPIIMA
jgi:hypothetical protein